MLFFRELGSLLAAGTPLDEALETVARVVRRGSLADAIATLRQKTRAGVPLHTAMASLPSAFDTVEVALLEAAATTGHLAPVCTELGERIAVVAEERSKILSGLAYPILLGLSACFLLPVPLVATESVAAFGVAVGTNLAIYLAALVALFVGIPRLLQSPSIRPKVLFILEKTPIVKGVVRDRRYMFVYGTLAATLRAGLPLPHGLALAGRTSGEDDVQDAAAVAVRTLDEGGGFADAIAKFPGVEDEAIGLFASAEKTGGLDIAMQRQADRHTKRYQKSIVVLGQVARFGGSMLVAAVIAMSVAGQFTKMLSDPLSMVPAGQRSELERELQRASPQLRPNSK